MSPRVALADLKRIGNSRAPARGSIGQRLREPQPAQAWTVTIAEGT